MVAARQLASAGFSVEGVLLGHRSAPFWEFQAAVGQAAVAVELAVDQAAVAVAALAVAETASAMCFQLLPLSVPF